MRNYLILLTLFTLLPQIAQANDSSAKLEAGGLRLIEETDIAMDSEDLYISRDKVRIEYVFRNTSSTDKRIVVAFPLPRVNLANILYGDVGVQSEDPVNFVDFKVMADNVPVPVHTDVRTWLDGRDITAFLKQHRIPLSPFAPDYYTFISNMPKSAFNALKAAGAIGPDSVPEDVHPRWTYQVGYYWEQLFPAGKPVKLIQTYRPVVGASVGIAEGLIANEDYIRTMRRDYCMDPPFINALKRMQASQRQQGSIIGYELGYILTTANNWRGPIGRFSLTIDKGTTKALVSLCASGIKKTGPTTFSLQRNNYMPQEDLKIFFAQPLGQ